jgi:hypothetical protein
MKKSTRRLSINARISKSKDDETSEGTLVKSRSFESLETLSHIKTVESKCHYKLSTEHISFLME